jgi:putative acetyltransferase
MGTVRIRAYEPRDAQALAALFFESVRQAGARDYSPAQVAAWAPAVPDAGAVDARCRDGRLTLVAVDEADTPIAYGDLEADGHIDHLYCHPDAIGTGVASALTGRLEQAAREQGIGKLYVEASEAARRLFARKGFTVVRRREIKRNGVAIHNYAMEKCIAAGQAAGDNT